MHKEESNHRCCGSGNTKCQKEFSLSKEMTRFFIALALFFIGFLFNEKLHDTPYSYAEYVVLLTAYFLSGYKVLFTAAKNIVRGKFFDENFLMSLATIGAIAIHQIPEAVGVMIFYQLGELFQEAAVNKSRRSITALLAVRPDYANVSVNGEIRKVSPEEIKVDQQIIVKPGERIPLDGVVVEGVSEIDTSAITGESMPRVVEPGKEVLASTVNKGGMLTVKVTKVFGESSISKILELVENANNKKTETEKFITKFSTVYTPVVVVIALIIAFVVPFVLQEQVSTWIYRALVLLVISCPCALVISIPLGYFGGVGWASRHGILVKGSIYLDELLKVKKVALDKTGTLTKGIFKVNEIRPSNSFKESEILEFASYAEAHSSHPLAKAIVNFYGKEIDRSLIKDLQEIGGHGIKAVIKGKSVTIGNDRILHAENIDHPDCNVAGTVVHIAIDKKYAGYIVVGDELKPDTKEAIAHLRKLGVKEIVMLTGDNQFAAQAISQDLNIDSFYSNLLPQDKVTKVEEITKKSLVNEKIAFVGDGINDAPVLASADVGIAMGGLGSDAAIETADVVLMADSLIKIATAIEIARITRKVIWQNIGLALGVKSIFLVLGALGVASMWEAVFADIGVALLAILNAVYMKRYKLHTV